jgi:DNA-binding winged helix-turn-helix (wHTH) protein
VLAALLERPGELVTREELIGRLWADGTVVDFERGLNAAVTRLRQVLSDTADAPKYVETVACRGYRFISPIEDAGQDVLSAALPATPPRVRTRPRLTRANILFGVTIMSLATAWWWFTSAYRNRSDSLLKLVPLTNGSGLERNPSFSPDGSQIVYEWEREDGGRHLYIKVVGTGDPIPLTSGATAEYGPAWSPDGAQIAFLRELDESKVGIFVIAPVGGTERKIIEAHAPPHSVLSRMYRRLDWTRDSRHLIVSVPDRPGGGEGLLLVSVESGENTWLNEALRRRATRRSGARGLA